MLSRALRIRVLPQLSISRCHQFWSLLNESLVHTDPELSNIIEKEKTRQKDSLVLIASENFTSRAVLDALGSVMSNKYSEGYPGSRYYGGNEFIDQAELLCQKRALSAFDLDPAQWGVNVQSLSGSPANFQVYNALLKPHDRIMSLDLPHGGHISHGYQTEKRKVSAVSAFFETFPYRLNEVTGLIDYDLLEANAALYRPKLLVAGASAYCRIIDHKRMKQICLAHGCYLMADMAHVAGLVAAKAIPSPFEYADIVTTTTHKSLRGPRGAMIFYKKTLKSHDLYSAPEASSLNMPLELGDKINSSVFPGLQGGPHNHTIAALATAMLQVKTPEFAAYGNQVVMNSKRMASCLIKKGYDLVSGGTDNHMVLVNLKKSRSIDGARVERVMELTNLIANKNMVPGDKSSIVPGGIRLGSPALTSRGLVERDFEQVVEFFDQSVSIAVELQSRSKTVKEFKAMIGDGLNDEKIQSMKEKVTKFAQSFPAIG